MSAEVCVSSFLYTTLVYNLNRSLWYLCYFNVFFYGLVVFGTLTNSPCLKSHFDYKGQLKTKYLTPIYYHKGGETNVKNNR